MPDVSVFAHNASCAHVHVSDTPNDRNSEKRGSLWKVNLILV